MLGIFQLPVFKICLQKSDLLERHIPVYHVSIPSPGLIHGGEKCSYRHDKGVWRCATEKAPILIRERVGECSNRHEVLEISPVVKEYPSEKLILVKFYRSYLSTPWFILREPYSILSCDPYTYNAGLCIALNVQYQE